MPELADPVLAAGAGGIGLWELDVATGRLVTTAAMRRNFGADDSAPPVAAFYRSLIHPDDVARVRAAGEQAIADDTPFDVEFRVVRADGVVWVYNRGNVVRAADGSPLRMAGVSFDFTAQRAAAEDLTVSEESLRLATDAAEVGTWDLDLTTGILTWSDRTKAMFGISRDVACSMADFYAGLHPDELEATSTAFASALDPAMRTTYDVEYRTVGAEDGVVRWVAAKGKALFDPAGRCTRALGTAIDITRRKSNEAIAAAQQAILAQLAEGVIVTDAAGRIVFVNRAAERLHGVAALGVDPTGYSDTYHLFREDGTPYPPEELPLARAVLRGETVSDSRWRIRRPDGSEVVAIGTAQPLGGAGASDGAVLTVRDDTARATAERELRELNETLATRVAERTRERDAIWRESRDMLLILDGDGTIEAVNPAWTATLGYSAEALVGRLLTEFAVADEVPSSLDALAVARQEALPAFSSRYRHADGSVRNLAWTAAPADGRVYCVARDVTAEKEAAMQLAVAQDALRQAQKMEAVGQLTGGIAHDFNNLLQIVVGNLDLLQRAAPGDTVRLQRLAANAMAGAERAATLTQRLLAFSRRQPLAPQPVAVNALVAGMSELIARALGETVTLVTDLDPGLWTAEADSNQLESAILNLAVNARDAMPDGGQLTITTANVELMSGELGGEARAGRYVMIAVADAGEGIDPATLARVFEPFFTTKDVGKGTGLGLAMVYGFVAQSNGHVAIASTPGAGTTVRLYLPRATGELPVTAARAPVATADAIPSETILVVEDDDDVRSATVAILRDLGYRVVVAADGAGALAALDGPGAAIDLVFTDIVLPGGMNGVEVARAARARIDGIRVVFTTGYARDAIGHDPAADMLPKPFGYADLAAKIRGALDRR